MNKIFTLLLLIFVFISCKNNKPQEQQNRELKSDFSEIIKEEYELYKPTKSIKAVLILFGGYPENIEDIKREFTILESAKDNDIAVLILNYNQKLW